ncbi:leukotriene C4 synthase isoform X1 [Mobula hypostoma]|uniref:leukotriene C4 synthase isoform X1 n=1 Tax=Mobula hypostoma TaxID=723540 RepID=UPI002FC3B1D1
MRAVETPPPAPPLAPARRAKNCRRHHCGSDYPRGRTGRRDVGRLCFLGAGYRLGRARARTNSTEYFPMFLSVLWIAGIFFSQALATCIGVLYLGGRYKYFEGYAESAQKRLPPLYFSAKMLWILVGMSSVGVLSQLLSQYLGYNPMASAKSLLPF